MDEFIKVKISEEDLSDRKRIFIVRKVGRDMDVVYSDKIQRFEEGAANIEPSLILNGQEFQALVDSIHKDFKPSEGKFTEGKLIGTERHLDDLRQMLKLK